MSDIQYSVVYTGYGNDEPVMKRVILRRTRLPRTKEHAMSDSLRDRLAESITDAIETVLDQHEFMHNTSRCSCGLRNNMDGDLLDLHRVSLIGETVRNTLALPHRRKPVTLGQSPPPKCLCGHAFHTGPCQWRSGVDTPGVLYCHCPNGELDGDR